jgi:hypothetical protein
MDLTPRGIREHLGLNRPIYARTSAYGHFGRAPEATAGSRGRRPTSRRRWRRTCDGGAASGGIEPPLGGAATAAPRQRVRTLTGRDLPERRNFYGRIHGKTLRPSQKRYMAEDLPRYRVTGVTRRRTRSARRST